MPNFLNGIHFWEFEKLVSQQYRAWHEYTEVQDGLTLYWWQRPFGFGRIRVNMDEEKIVD